jgi:lipopolysaccharide/colanic/teichoic acid biosynthesis glycosyltransferase
MEQEQLTIPFNVKSLHTNIVLKVTHKIKELLKAFIKRIFEIIFSSICLIFLLPLTVIVGIKNIVNKDSGPIFYTQNRIGKNGKIFKMYKFRTMEIGADEKLKKILSEDEKLNNEYKIYKKLQNDPRLTKTGKFLRSTGLDEFPQMLNVFKGQMCIVGPRPYLPEEQEEMGTYYSYIVQHKPGITGISQISGKPRVAFADRLDMDIKYHYKRNFIMDVKIALITLLVTLKNRNTYADIGMQVDDLAGYIAKGLTLAVKRLIDICGAIVGIAILVPITIAVAIANFFNKETGPIFYTQERIGKNGKHFQMYKFRSMVVGADEILKKMLEENEDLRNEFEESRKLKNDPRITKIGRFLRKTSLDEFPQFINVLKGEMSLVGPRAVVDGEIEKFGNHKKEVLSVKPGITGYWAANGRSNTTYNERVEMEAYYVNNISIPLDIKILFKTVISVLKKEGAV